MKFATAPAPHLRGADGVPDMMRRVLLALLPAVIVHTWYFGVGIICNILLASAVAVGSEALMLYIRKKPVAFYLSDYSAVVTAVLLAFALPSLTPWWITAIGSGFAIIVAKHLYGGLGYNIFNPAMAGYAALLISFPEELSRWPLPRMENIDMQSVGIYGTLTYFFSGNLPAEFAWDAVAGATPLDTVQTQLGLSKIMDEISISPIFGNFGGLGWEWINLAIAGGGIWLLKREIIQWTIPAGVLGSLLICATIAYLFDASLNPSPMLHLFSGSAMLGAFFIATDPVSAAASRRGRLIYGAGIGVLTYIIRRWGSYPDGVAFAVLLMNLAVPLVDRFTQPRIYGKK
jgi:electron transport complex protein RnfD